MMQETQVTKIKINVENKWPIVERDILNTAFGNTINVLKNTASKVILSFYTKGTGLTYTTSGAPSGMTFTMGAMNGLQQDFTINWTPSPAQSKSVANMSITFTNPTGLGNSITIPLSFKVFDTL